MKRAWFEPFFRQQWQRNSAWQIVLQPLAWLFAGLSALRRGLYRSGLFTSTKIAVPVIVVGNISVGGTGKTPLVVALANRLAQNGRHVGIVTRGYARAAGGQSDEAVLISQRSAAPVVENQNRVAAAQACLAKFSTTNIVIADDGLQHYRLQRDLEIAVIDGARGFGNGYLLPAGPLREQVARLQSVDCVVINKTGIDQMTNPAIGAVFAAKLSQTPQPSTSLFNVENKFSKPIFTMTYGRERFASLNDQQLCSVEDWCRHTQGKRIAAIAGIGNPERFFAHLEALGLSLHSRHAFADHHPFVVGDLMAIDAEIMLMTEKDAVKCRVFANQCRAQLWQMQIDAILPEAFYDFVIDKLNKIDKKLDPVN